MGNGNPKYPRLVQTEMTKKLGHKNISGGFKKILYQMLSKGTISCTNPEKPNSRLQKYKLEFTQNEPTTNQPT